MYTGRVENKDVYTNIKLEGLKKQGGCKNKNVSNTIVNREIKKQRG